VISKHISSILSVCLFLLINKSMAAITCSEPKEECVEGQGEIRNIENFPLNPGCWKYKVTYECKEIADNNCQKLRDQGCSQISASCRTKFKDTCVVQNETYNCPSKKCELKEVPCAKNLFCTDGKCAATNPIQATDDEVGRGLSQLSALNEVASKVKEQNSRDFVLFTGKVMECSSYALPGLTKDCCCDNPGIFKCDAEDEELSVMKKSGRAIEVGKYCNNKDSITKTCFSYHTAYCVFDSKIARIIQNDGRKNQLGIGFGYVNDDDKKTHVNCRGITKEELAKMKFNLMDFSELYEELKKEAEGRAPKEEELKQKSSEYSYDDLKSKSTKNLGISGSPETGIGLKAAERIKDFYGDRIKK